MTGHVRPGGGSRPTRGGSHLVGVLRDLLLAALGIARVDGTGGGALVLGGTVVDASGHPVPDARVAFTTTPVPVPDIALLTGEDGEFSVAVPAEGSYGLAAVTDAGRAEETVEVRRGSTNRVRLVVPA